MKYKNYNEYIQSEEFILCVLSDNLCEQQPVILFQNGTAYRVDQGTRQLGRMDRGNFIAAIGWRKGGRKRVYRPWLYWNTSKTPVFEQLFEQLLEKLNEI